MEPGDGQDLLLLLGMKTKAIKVPLRDGVMGAHVAFPDRAPAGERSGNAMCAPITPSRRGTLMAFVFMPSNSN